MKTLTNILRDPLFQYYNIRTNKNYKVKFIDIVYKERIGISKLEPLKAAWWTVIRILRARFKRI